MQGIDTPLLIIDKAVMLNNITRLQSYVNEHRLQLRPHIKTHKSTYCARQQLDAGAVGITCQKIGEAEIMAAAGCDDIFISFNIVGEVKYKRLKQLMKKTRLRVSVDNPIVAQGLNDTLSPRDGALEVLVECDTGMHRCGVTSPEAAVDLAQRIDTMEHLKLKGLMTYPLRDTVNEVSEWLTAAKDLFEKNGLCCDIVSGGNTPNMFQQHFITAQNEIRCGTYILNDSMMQATGVCNWDDCAARMLATVVSTPAPNRAIIDAGIKALSAEKGWVTNYGSIVEYPAAEIYALNEEHGYIRSVEPLTLGEIITIIPNHICVTMNLQDEVYIVDGESLETIKIEARGQRGIADLERTSFLGPLQA